MIKQKIGKCLDCPPEAGEKPIMAKRCINGPYYHHKKHKTIEYQNKLKARQAVKKKRISDNNNGMTVAQWFNQQINQLPKHCENCDEYLNPYMPWMAHCYIAHILPQRHFESVVVHPLNRMFLCEPCHSKYDKSLSNEIVMMRCWPIAVERFKVVKLSITQAEVYSLADCFAELY